ncbi:hypothetical protein P152DRAFT_119240 [Eremomyces bilateralis CBS 781.70]|uniref:PQ loop repeat protein n=1 Tax=Eremomyces bilateralis CBS 781.70 TaxID=1392243 RepID=A0A6G1GE37_9PEZI|nr:uncharacterized protein P152DRAFT_119240 [Eremomyces bilateralis CBS 781.70]KAF1816318.1 hypothetical protein P152DRAFT_119240 [Eremomyces bilateralis CBS 781.70]
MDIPTAANVLGTMGAVCWSIQLIPQIIINYRRHHAIGLQPSMMMLWAWAGVPLGVYNIVEEFNIALRIQPQLLTCLSLITWIQCYYYNKHWSIVKTLYVVVPIAVLMAGLQVALIVALRIARDRHIQWPMTLMAVLSAVLLAAGVLRHYVDIVKHKTVRGISFLFVALDAAGDLFSLISVLFQTSVDVLGLVIYGSELILWLGVFAAGGYLNLRPWLKKKYGKESKTAEREGIGAVDGNPSDDAQEANNSVALHDLPSSTSVFRTASSDTGVSRMRGTHTQPTDAEA